ncbi:MAG: hypothetical protein ACLTLY_07600 [Agathobacter rectalis]
MSEQHYDDVSRLYKSNESEHDFFTVGHTSASVNDHRLAQVLQRQGT